MSGLVCYRAYRHEGRGIAGAAAPYPALDDVVIDLEKLARMPRPGCAGHVRRAAVPGSHHEPMGPDVPGSWARAVFFGLKKGDEVDVTVIVPGIGDAIGPVIVEIVPDGRALGALRYHSQGAQEQLSEPADRSRRAWRQDSDPIAAVFVVGVDRISCNPVEYPSGYSDISVRDLLVKRLQGVGSAGGVGLEEQRIVLRGWERSWNVAEFYRQDRDGDAPAHPSHG